MCIAYKNNLLYCAIEMFLNQAFSEISNKIFLSFFSPKYN